MMIVHGFEYVSGLSIGRDQPGNSWRLLHPYDFRVKVELDGIVAWEAYVVPTNFETDFASVPRLFRGIVSKIGKHAEAAVIHDWMYVARKRGAKQTDAGIKLTGNDMWRFERRFADDVFNAAMKAAGVGWLKRRTMWAAVRLAGGFVRGEL